MCLFDLHGYVTNYLMTMKGILHLTLVKTILLVFNKLKSRPKTQGLDGGAFISIDLLELSCQFPFSFFSPGETDPHSFVPLFSV